VTGWHHRRLLSLAGLLASVCCCWAPSGAGADLLPPPGNGVFTGLSGGSYGAFESEVGKHPAVNGVFPRMALYNQGERTNGPFRLSRYPNARREIRRLIASPRFLAYAPEWHSRISALALAVPTLADGERYSPESPSAQNPNDVGLYVAFCPGNAGVSSLRASAAGTSEAGWPAKECLKMDKGPAGRRHTLVGQHGVHNWLLGGYGNDTIIGGDIGDVIWGDYHPNGEPRWQSATIHAGNGRNVIYANDTVDYVWTGTNPRTVVHAHNGSTSGVIHCQSSGIVVFLSTVSERHFKLDGCHHISHFSVGY
jgi:hypothetical protein